MSNIRSARGKSGFLTRLARDQRGATMAMMTASIIPLVGLVGGAMDMSRVYLAKARLQQACDAGALAGRKRMGAGQWNQANNAPNTVANRFFESNFSEGAYGTSGLTKTFVEQGGRVTGTASVDVPMTLMKVFNYDEMEVDVTCDADMRIPNTDIMFVLDVTGSMEADAGGQTRIQALKSAVKCFYQVVARLDSNQDCDGTEPTGGTGDATQIRFGFVPYATNVNVGRLLPTAYFADTWEYQTRERMMRNEVVFDFENGTPGEPQVTGTEEEDFEEVGQGTTTQHNNVPNAAACNALKPDDSPAFSTGPESAPYNEQTVTNGNTRTTTWQTRQPYRVTDNYRADYQSNQRRCRIKRRTTTHTLIRNYTRVDQADEVTREVFDKWRYAQLPVDISPLKSGTSWNTSFQLPIGNTTSGAAVVSPKTITWDGCIEERETEPQASYNPIPDGALDLDIDLVPSSAVEGSLWAPALHNLIYFRGTWQQNSNGNWVFNRTRDPQETTENKPSISGRGNNGYFCPVEAKKLQSWPTASAFDAYVDGLTTGGNTYHDIGLLWGARFISPTGIFASENAQTPNGGSIERHLVFMTDGEACTGVINYLAYGVEWYDRRRTSNPTDGCNPNGTITQQVNARYAALCRAVRNQNITLWVVSFAVAEVHEAGLRACATTGRFYSAANATELREAFTAIATQISQLRLTQ